MMKVYIPAAGWYSLDAAPVDPPNPPIDPPIPPEPPVGPLPPGRVIQLTWGESVSWKSRHEGGFRCEETLVFVFDVPADATGFMRFAVSNYDSMETVRQLALSTIPGSFDPATTITPSQGSPTVWCNSIPGGNVQRGGRYFINVRNFSTDLNVYTCLPGTQMDVIANWIAA